MYDASKGNSLPAASDLPASSVEKPRASLTRRLIFVVIVLCCCVLLGELTLRGFLLQERAFRKPRSLSGAAYVQKSENPILYYEHLPGAMDTRLRTRHMVSLNDEGGHAFEKKDINVELRINQDGFRGPEWVKEASPGTIRIAHIGDSELFAVRLEEHETPSARLEHHLSEQFPASSFEVLNFGVGGYNSEQQLEVLRTKALQFTPDIVIVNFITNDPQVDVKAVLQNASPSALLALLKYYVAWGGTPFERIGPCEFNYEYLNILFASPYWDATAELIRRMARLSARAGAGFMLVIQPDLQGIDSFDPATNPYMPVYRKVEALADDGLPVINGLAALAQFDIHPVRHTVTNDDWHLGSFAVDQIAKQTAESAELDRLVREAVSRKAATEAGK